MEEFVKSVSGENNLPLVPEEQLDFTMKLYDLNQVWVTCGVCVCMYVVCKTLRWCA